MPRSPGNNGGHPEGLEDLGRGRAAREGLEVRVSVDARARGSASQGGCARGLPVGPSHLGSPAFSSSPQELEEHRVLGADHLVRLERVGPQQDR